MRETDIKSVFDGFRYSERLHETDFDRVRGLPIMSKDALRSTPMDKGLYACRTSGSTGEPVSVEKSYGDQIWYFATNIREFFWRKWDLSKNIAVIRGDAKMNDKESWGVPRTIAKVQGNTFFLGFEPISRIQSWVEEKNPHYLQCLPSIRKQLDMGKVGNFIDQSNEDLYLFSSDYPHIEGGRNPIGRFEASLGERPAIVRDKFYAENFLRIFPNARVDRRVTEAA